MRTVHLTIDEPLLAEVDKVVEAFGATRSAFTREALRAAVRRIRIRQMETEDAEAYARQPQDLEEILPWFRISVRDDEWPSRPSAE